MGGGGSWGCTQVGQQGPLDAEKKTFFKNDPRPRVMPKQVFLARFEPVVTLRKSQNALKMGYLGSQNGSKMGTNVFFQK